jgi:hypothetical protein
LSCRRVAQINAQAAGQAQWKDCIIGGAVKARIERRQYLRADDLYGDNRPITDANAAQGIDWLPGW